MLPAGKLQYSKGNMRCQEKHEHGNLRLKNMNAEIYAILFTMREKQIDVRLQCVALCGRQVTQQYLTKIVINYSDHRLDKQQSLH